MSKPWATRPQWSRGPAAQQACGCRHSAAAAEKAARWSESKHERTGGWRIVAVLERDKQREDVPFETCLAAIEADIHSKETLRKVRVGDTGGNQVLSEDVSARTPPRWSPHGAWISYTANGALTLISSDRKETKAVAKGSWLSHQWSRKTALIFGIREDKGFQHKLGVFQTPWRSQVPD